MRFAFIVAGVLGLVVSATVTPSFAGDAAAPSDSRVVAVRQAAHVATLIQMHRSVELSTLTPENQRKVIAVIDPLLEKQRKLIADVKEHPEKSEKDATDAESAFKDGMKALMDAVAVDDRPKLDESAKTAKGEALLFNAKWPVAGHPDPLPDLIKKAGLDDKQVEALQKLRGQTLAAKDALLDEQTAAMMAAGGNDNNGKPVDSKLWTDEIGALGTRAAGKFAASLTDDQRAKWNDAIRATFPIKRPAAH